MSQQKANDSASKQSDHMSEEDLAKQRAGTQDKSSHDHMSREKAGSHEGAGGGAKQKQQH
ncbi:hypothetical protein ACFPOU_08900 [Massilia jejuensis]|uniref:Uncharacterized protein n=1 Tax=Massilia jejuensis TaxID=648894 RepID=A0ABW0PG30_9BURK